MSAPSADLPSTAARVVDSEVDTNSEEKIDKSAEEAPLTSSDLPSSPTGVDPEVDTTSKEKIDDETAEEKTSSDLPSTPARVDPEVDTTSEEKIDDETAEEEVDSFERLDNIYANFVRDIEYGPASKKFKVQFDWAEEREPWVQPPIIAGGDDPSSVLGNLISDLDPVDAKQGRGDRKIWTSSIGLFIFF